MGLFKSLGRIVKKATKPVKKVLKSDLGKLALMYGAYRYGPGLLDKNATGWGNVNWKGIPAWKIGAASGVLSLAGSMDEEEDKITDVADTAGHDAYLKYRKYFPFGEEEPIFTSAQGGRVPANIGLYAGPQAAMNQNMNPNMNQGVGSMNPLGLGAPTSMNAGRPSMDPRVAQERSTPTMPAQLSKPPQENADAELIQLIKMLTAMGFPMEQLRGRTKDELVEMLVAVSGKGGEEVEEAEVVEASTGGRIGYDIGGSPHSEVVEKQEDIEMAGTDTPILELEDLPKLLEDFYEIFGRSPTSIDELKSWAANRTTEAPEEVVEEQVVEANTGGRIGSFEGGDPKDRFLSGMTSEWEGIMGEADKFYTDAETVPLVQKGEFPEPETLLKLKKRYEDLENKASDIEGRYEDHEEFLVDDESKPIANKYYIDKVKKFDKEEIRLDEREKKLNEIYSNLDVSGITRSPDFQNWFKLYEAGNPKAEEHSYHDVFEDILFQSGYSKRMRDLKIERDSKAQGGLPRTGYALGQPVIPSKDGMQLDMRDAGGYQPHGKAEKHDDVRALLAQGEFVMTSDAVKGMGGGDRELGAQKMYNLMHSMEAMA